MKKMIALLLALAALLGCTACGQKEEAPTVELDVTEMRAICELSTMDCYYHNVAKYFEKDAQKGFLGIGKKDKRFWMEYSGVVRMGIDVSLVKVEVEDMQVTITIPEAKVLKCTVTPSPFPKIPILWMKTRRRSRRRTRFWLFLKHSASWKKRQPRTRHCLPTPNREPKACWKSTSKISEKPWGRNIKSIGFMSMPPVTPLERRQMHPLKQLLRRPVQRCPPHNAQIGICEFYHTII